MLVGISLIYSEELQILSKYLCTNLVVIWYFSAELPGLLTLEHSLTNHSVQCNGFSISSGFILCMLKSSGADERIECGGMKQGDSFVIRARKQRGHSIEMDEPYYCLRFLHCLFIPGDQGAASTTASRACKCVIFELWHCLQPLQCAVLPRNVSPVGVLMTP